MRRMTWLGVVASVLAVPLTAWALNLMSPGGFLFDISETSNGQLSNGTSDAYDQMYYLNVNGTRYNAAGAAATTSLGGRQVDMAEVAIGDLMVRRTVYVPMGTTGMNYARYVDIVRNPTAAPVAATVLIDGTLGSNFSTAVTGSSSGDTTVSTADTWFTTDDSTDGGGDPSLGHVFAGPGASVAPTTAMISTDNPTWTYDVMIPAGESRGFMFFAIQEMTRAESMTEARRLVDLPPDAFLGLDAIAGDIVNFAVGGAPVVRFTAPTEIDEGAETLIEIEVEDLEGDTPLSWTWDTDDDGMFDELPGATSYTIPAGSTDGDGIVRVGVEASDGTESRQVYWTINVNNVAPTITSDAPTIANVRREYSYTPVIDEPAGTNDPIRYILVTRPMGMEIDRTTGTITWTPSVEQRARTFDVALQIDDGDEGAAEQAWRIEVADNSPPEAPVPISPIDRMRVAEGESITLVAENATDPDGDELIYFFRVSQTSDFMNPDVVGSGELDEDPSGMTSWTIPDGLDRGLWYWEVWVDDGITESFHRFAQVVVGEVDVPGGDAGPAMPIDGGTGGVDAGSGGGSGGGCNASASGSTNALGLLGLLGVVVLSARRRRRS